MKSVTIIHFRILGCFYSFAAHSGFPQAEPTTRIYVQQVYVGGDPQESQGRRRENDTWNVEEPIQGSIFEDATLDHGAGFHGT